MTKPIGALVSGVALNEPLSNKVLDELHTALQEHQVLFFRNQPMDHDSHERLGRYFGELAGHSGVGGIEGHPNVVKIHADADSKFIAGEGKPPMGSILYLHTVPPVGGDTLFASMYAAYDALSPAMKAFIDPLTAVHDSNHIYRALFPDVDKKYPTNTHPLVRTHPVSKRKCLFFSKSKIIRINGLTETEGEALRDFLARHCENPNFQVRFRWEPHSIAFWDNRCTQHFAMNDYQGFRREMVRTSVKGSEPQRAA